MPASGKKERNAARHVRVDLFVQRLEVHLEQCPEQDGHGDEIEEDTRRGCQALRREGRQRSQFVGLCQLAQQLNPEVGAEIARGPADRGAQFGEAARFRDGQPHQRDPVAVQTPVQQGAGGAGEALLDG